MEKRLFAFIDFLGYSNFLTNNSIEEVARIVNGNIGVNIESAIVLGKKDINGDPDWDNLAVNCYSISDSLCLVARSNDEDAIDDFFEVCRRLVLDFNSQTFGLRGCISYGYADCFAGYKKIDNRARYSVNILIGDTIVKCHKYCESQAWSNIMLLPEVLELILEEKLKDIATIYPVPFKNEKIEEFFVLNWFEDKISQEYKTNMKRSIAGAFNGLNKNLNNDSHVQIKLDNTIQYFERTY